MQVLPLCLWLLYALVAPQAYGLQTTKCDTTEAERARYTLKALKQLEDTYEILPGSLSFPDFAQPAGRYGLVAFDGQEINPPALCAITSGVNTPYGPGLCNFSFVLGPRDAVVGLFCTPPPVKYFSLRSYTGFRFRPQAWLPAVELADPDNNLTFNTTGKASGIMWREGCIRGDMGKRAVTKKEGVEDDESPFCKTALFVSTADGATAREAHEAFRSAGWPEAAMNLDVVSAEKAYFRNFRLPWVVDRSDAFVINFRVSQPLNRTAVEPYYFSSYPFYMLRHKSTLPSLRPVQQQHELGKEQQHKQHQQEDHHHRYLQQDDLVNQPREPLTTPPLRPRGTGDDEEYLLPSLAALEDSVISYMDKSRGAKLHARWEMEHVLPDTGRCLTEPDYYPIAENVKAWNLSGIATCGFFSRDCLYSFLALPDTGKIDYADITFPRNRSFVFVGANQVRLQKVTYSNIFMTSILEPQKPGRTVNYSADALEGSANWYLPALPDANDLYAVTLTRDACYRRPPPSGEREGGGNEGVKEPFCTTVGEKVLSYEEFVYVVERKYLQPATMIGPNPDEVLAPIVLVFETPEDTVPGPWMSEGEEKGAVAEV